jgi:hypothetical protein
MNDQDLLAAVRRDFDSVQMDVPAETILASGWSRRRRRRGAKGLAMTAVVATGLGLGVSALASAANAPLAPARHASALPSASTRHTGDAAHASAQPSSPVQHTRDATLAAWTVVRRPDGAIAVTVRDLTNIAGLQQRLNALGVPIAVYSRVRTLPGCLDIEGPSPMNGIVIGDGPLSPQSVFFVVHPAVIPRGDTLQIAVVPPGWPSPGPAPHQRLPKGVRVFSSSEGFAVRSATLPSINFSLIHTGSNCS